MLPSISAWVPANPRPPAAAAGCGGRERFESYEARQSSQESSIRCVCPGVNSVRHGSSE
jgi:hypothetical protein